MDKKDKERKPKGIGWGLQLFVATLLAAAHIGLVYGRDAVTFHWPDHPEGYMYGIPVLFVLFTVFVYALFLDVIYRLYRRDRVFLSYLKYFLLYFVFIGIFWLLCWPGIFKGDEFYTINAALDFKLSAMQSGLTSLFYICALMFFPSMAAICGFQLLVICSIFAVVVKERFENGKKGRRYLVFVPFVLLPVIDADLFTLRASLVGWLFLLFLHKLAALPEGKEENMRGLLPLTILCGLICAWRSEFIYLLLLLPLALWLWKKRTIRQALLCLLLICVFRGMFAIPNKIAENGQNKYPISLVLNPLANLFTEAESLRGPDVYDDIMTINELVDVRLLRQNASVRNISQYWNIEDVVPKEQLSRFMKAAIRLIVYNPEKFLKYRWQTFCYTNGFYPGYINHPGGEDVNAILSLSYYDRDYRDYFVLMDAPLGQALRQKVIELLACRHYESGNIRTNALLPVFYNVLWPVLGLCVLLGVAIKRKNRDLIWKILFVGLQLVLIFLTAPAMFFMYYFCLYLNGYVLLFDAAAEG
ncbi:MAG: hypothetical protein K6E18_06945 [Lachnospiraceae bacterium]|nr:hypothetical protein [Lachnospiraceae bacterium]